MRLLNHTNERGGFSLVEMMAVVVVIGVLATVAVVSINGETDDDLIMRLIREHRGDKPS